MRQLKKITERCVTPPQKVLVRDQFFATMIARRNVTRQVRRDRASRKVDALQGVLDVQRARVTLSIAPVPIEQPQREVTRLLNFRERDAGSDRVNRAGRNGDHVTGSHGDRVQALLDSAGCEMSFERDLIDVGFQSDAHAAVRLGQQDHPGFRFSALSQSNHGGLNIVRVNLNGQRLGRVEELEQQRKLSAACMSAEQLIGIFTHQIVQQTTVEWTAEDSTLIDAEIDDFPTLGPAR